MKRWIVLATALLAVSGAQAQNRGDLRTIMTADIVGVWALGSTFAYLYEDGRFKMLNESDCSLVGVGTWTFEYAQFSAKDTEGREVFWMTVIDVPVQPTPGQKLLTDSNREWMFIGRDTSMEC